jgi:hypothetical protein
MATLSALSICVVGQNYEAPRISLTAFHSTAPDNQQTSGVRPKLDRSTHTRKNHSRRSAGLSPVNIARDVGRGARDNQATASLVEAHVPAERRDRWFGIACISQRPFGGRLRSGWVI